MQLTGKNRELFEASYFQPTFKVWVAIIRLPERTTVSFHALFSTISDLMKTILSVNQFLSPITAS